MIEDIRKDLISVIVPVYNVERDLRECLDSLLSQTYPNLEIILIDDGSEDSSGAICDEYASNNENIKAIHKANQGLGIARNVGLQKMHGKYVTFVDSDDYVDKAYIEKLYRGVIDNQVDVCKLGFTRFGDGTKPYKSTEYKDIKFEDKEARNKFLPLMLGSSPESSDAIEMCVCGTIYLAEHITNHMVTFPSERNLISEDLIFNIEYMQYACGACLLNDNSYYYRINPKSLSKRYLADRVVKYCSFYRYEVNRLTQLGYPHDVILRCSRQFFVNLRYAIKQENRQISKKPMKSSCNAIRDICFNDLVIKILNDYPIYKLGRKQKIFLMLIQKRACKVLYLLASFNII